MAIPAQATCSTTPKTASCCITGRCMTSPPRNRRFWMRDYRIYWLTGWHWDGEGELPHESQRVRLRREGSQANVTSGQVKFLEYVFVWNRLATVYRNELLRNRF